MAKKINVEGKVALVTGANRGIGNAIATELLDRGVSKLYAGARDVSSLDDLKEKYGEKVVPLKLDVTDDSDIKELESITDVDILVNNAGVLAPDGFVTGNVLDNMDSHFDINVFGVIKVISALYESMKDRDSGAIVTVSSVVGLGNMPAILSYSASKAAVHSVIQGLRGELTDSNILVAGVYPGPIDTDMAKGFEMDKESPQNVAKEVVNGIENGTEEIFPDPMAKQVGETYEQSPKQLEKNFSGY